MPMPVHLRSQPGRAARLERALVDALHPMPVEPIELRHVLDAELAAQIDHRVGEPDGDPLLIDEPVNAHALWPVAVLAPVR